MDKIYLQRLETLMDKKGVRQLANQLGISYSMIMKWYSGKTYPRARVIIKIVKFFGCKADYFLGLIDE